MRRHSFLVAILVLVVQAFAVNAQTTFTVTNTNTSGLNSFSAAIANANSTPGVDIINFNITGTGPFTIFIGSTVLITEAVTIDGFSQPGSIAASSSNIATLMIIFKGTAVPIADGLNISGVNNVNISGITFNGFAVAIAFDNSQNSTVKGCYIGMDNTGLLGDDLFLTPVVYRNNYGITIKNNSSGCLIGGVTPADRNVINGNNYSGIDLTSAGISNQILGNYIGINANGNTVTNCYNANGVSVTASNETQVGDDLSSGGNVISGNYNTGVMLNGSNNCTVTGNYIGTDPTGTLARPNVQGNVGGAVYIAGGNDNVIGGPGGKRNIISGNNAASSTSYGAVYIHGYGTGTDGLRNVVVNNYIGVTVDGFTPLPNIRGIYIDNSANQNKIGDGTAGGANIIAYSANEALVVDGAVDNRIMLNSFFCNGSGITNSNGGNGLHLTPTIYAVNNQRIRGQATAYDSVFVYKSTPGCGSAQGTTFLIATKADLNGVWEILTPTITPTLSIGDNVVAIAYNAAGSTSRFTTDQSYFTCTSFIVDAGTYPDACVGTSINLNATLGANQTGTWTLANGTASIISPNSPSSTLSGLSVIGLVVLKWDVMDNISYCNFSAFTQVNVINCNGGGGGQPLEVYNMVSPNGDNIYDFLKIKNAELYSDVHLTIVNRWGDEVFDIHNYDNVNQIFTGQANEGPDKGKLLPDGTYFYKIEYQGGSDLRGFLEIKK